MGVSREEEIRWLLRPLCEVAFVRMYLEDEALPIRCFEDAFFRLKEDAEHTSKARNAVWKNLTPLLSNGHPTLWYRAILELLAAPPYENGNATILDNARLWALPEIFLPPTLHQQHASPELAYSELHCHFGGAVPYLSLWTGWLANARRRAPLRKFEVEDGPWKKTWAELVVQAADIRIQLEAVFPVPRSEDEWLLNLANEVRRGGYASTCAVKYLSICALLRRQSLYHRGQTGLAPFSPAYVRYRNLQKPGGGERALLRATREQVTEVLRRFADNGADTVELRPTLEATPYQLRRKLKSLIHGYLDYCRVDRRPMLFGLVPSLFKQEGKASGWDEQAGLWRDQVQILLAALDDDPLLRWFVVGLDAAGQERGCPPQALVPAFKLIHEYNRQRPVPARRGRAHHQSWDQFLQSIGSNEREALRYFGDGIPPARLGLTVHAGEDFDDPVTGLRHIWEAIELLGLRAGDRMGHALVIGLEKGAIKDLLGRRAGYPSSHEVKVHKTDPKEFTISKPRGTHLLDLAWEYRLRNLVDDKTAEHRLASAMQGVFGLPAQAVRLANDLSHPGPIPRPALPGVRYYDPKNVSAHDRELVLVDENWLARYEQLRRHVLAKLIEHQIVIESCPTSNCVVANLLEPPIFALLEERNLRVVMATDDPGLLGCYPKEELRFLSRCRGGPLRPEQRERLLKEARRASFVHRLPSD